ncbi:hypothetical protein [Heyndrickxia acidicola]|uniref:Uncharacterized protein n=1 Tax=Heyndrickxia acidicola TaxID=209389 RepID=A0ABU6MRA0_9BACI|nr:hypothetical protein [Heyndrickxia acidicola]MED1205575.1 hypothetical protein [Heyndrickxia acidicola]
MFFETTKMCTYCGKQFREELLKPMVNDDNPNLERVYCPSCLPEVEDNIKSLPWVKNQHKISRE